MNRLDEALDELGFAHKPGSTKGRMYSSRFYHKELKHYIVDLFLELIGGSQINVPYKVTREARNQLRIELREKVKSL